MIIILPINVKDLKSAHHQIHKIRSPWLKTLTVPKESVIFRQIKESDIFT